MMEIRDYLSRNVPMLDTLNYISFVGLSITTLYTANYTALDKLAPALGQYSYLAPYMALAIGMAIVTLFDGDLRKQFVTACQLFTASDWKQAKASIKAVALFFLFIAVVRLGLSGGATFISTVFLADSMVDDGGTEGLEAMLEQKQATKQAIAVEMSRQASETRQAAERRAVALVDAAVNSAGKERARLWRSGNAWLRVADDPSLAAWRGRIAQAEKQAEAIRAEAEKQVASLSATQGRAIEAEQADAAFQAVVGMKQRQVEKAEAKEWVTRLALWIADLVMALFAVLSSVALAATLKYRPDYVMFREETGAGAIVKEAFLSVWRIAKSYGVALVGWLDRRSESVISSIGATVTIEGRNVALQRRNDGATLRETPATQGATDTGDGQENASGGGQDTISNGVAEDFNLLAQRLGNARANVRAYRSKIRRNDGSRQANEAGLARWQGEVERLEMILQEAGS